MTINEYQPEDYSINDRDELYPDGNRIVELVDDADITLLFADLRVEYSAYGDEHLLQGMRESGYGPEGRKPWWDDIEIYAY